MLCGHKEVKKCEEIPELFASEPNYILNEMDIMKTKRILQASNQYNLLNNLKFCVGVSNTFVNTARCSLLCCFSLSATTAIIYHRNDFKALLLFTKKEQEETHTLWHSRWTAVKALVCPPFLSVPLELLSRFSPPNAHRDRLGNGFWKFWRVAKYHYLEISPAYCRR